MPVQGTLGGETIRRALDVTSIEAASNLVRQWTDAGTIGAVKEEPARIGDAVTKYLDGARARHLAEATITKLSTIFEKQFLAWTKDRGLGQNFSAPPQQASHPISTSVVLSQPAAAASLSEVWHDERWCLKRKREILAGNVTPRYITMQPGQTSEWTSLSEHEDRRKTWFVMADGKVRETIRFWDDTYVEYWLNASSDREEWNTPAKDARWGRWKNEDSKPVTVRLWIFD